MALFPGALPAAGAASPSSTLSAAGHTSLHNTGADESRAIATKVGTGASTPSPNTVLTSTVAGASSWSKVDLTAMVSGILPLNNGGTGQNNLTSLPLVSPVITNGGSWAGAPVFGGNAQFTSQPIITDFTNMQHDHSGNSKGGQLGTTALNNATVTADKLATGSNSAFVATSETTGSTSYVTLTTTTDRITVTVGANGLLLVGIYCALSNSGANFSGMSFALSGANTQSANDNFAIAANGTNLFRMGAVFLLTGLTPGSTVVFAEYSVNAGTGTFSNRRIFAVPL